MSGLHEECGVFGVFAEQPIDAARIAYYGLYALQHRGQESCGIVTADDGVFASHKDVGLVGEVYPEKFGNPLRAKGKRDRDQKDRRPRFERELQTAVHACAAASAPVPRILM